VVQKDDKSFYQQLKHGRRSRFYPIHPSAAFGESLRRKAKKIAQFRLTSFPRENTYVVCILECWRTHSDSTGTEPNTEHIASHHVTPEESSSVRQR